MHKLLTGHECSTAQQRGWGGMKNGDLLRLAEGQFDLFITSDQNIRYQQNLAGRRIPILELSTNKLRFPFLRINSKASEVTNAFDHKGLMFRGFS
jgi:hypothetical protein